MDERSVRALFDAVPEAVALVEYVDGEPIVRRVNDPFEQRFGYDADAVRGENINDFVVPDDDQQRAVAAELDAVAAAGDPVERRVERETAQGTRTFLFRASPFEDDGTVKSVGIYVDVTEREHERQRYELLLEQASDVLTILEPDGTIRYESPSIERILGYDVDELVGEDAFEYVHPADRDAVVAEFRRGLSDPSTTPKAEYRFRAADGSWRTLESIGSNYIDRPEVEGFVVTSRDVTERKRRERELRRQNERLDEFASIISHDLRNPISVASGHLELAQKECDSEHLDAVGDALDRIETLVDDTLALARQGETIEEPAPVDLETVAERAWRNVNTNGTSMVVEDAGRVLADADRLQELLENLFVNAVEHGSTGDQDLGRAGDAGADSSTSSDSEARADTGHGTTDPDESTELRVRVEEVADGFCVADDGVGIDEDERDVVFEPGHTTEPDGTGMGLAIVAEIADAHGWDVAVTDSEEGGARFEFTGVERP